MSIETRFFFGIVASRLAGLPEFLIRLIPSAKSLLNAPKLNLERNNVRGVNHGSFYALINLRMLYFVLTMEGYSP